MQLARYIKPHFIRPISKEIKPPIKSEPKITIPDIVKGVTLAYRGNTVPKSFEFFTKAENLFNQGHTSDALRYAKEAHQAF